MNKRVWIVVLALGAVLYSCRTGKEVGADLEKKKLSELVTCANEARLELQWLSVKVGTDLVTASGEDFSFRTSIRIKRDSVIWLNIGKGPAIVSTVVITPDSIKVVNKVGDKWHMETDFGYIQRRFDIDLGYRMLEDLILGNPVAFDAEEKYKQLKDSAYYLLSTHSERQIEKAFEKLPRREEKQFIQRYWLRPDDCKIHRTLINYLVDTSSIDMVHHDYKEEQELLLPNKVTMVGYTPRDTVSLELNYSRYKVNKPLKFPYRVGNNYSKLEDPTLKPGTN